MATKESKTSTQKVKMVQLKEALHYSSLTDTFLNSDKYELELDLDNQIVYVKYLKLESLSKIIVPLSNVKFIICG